ncbi:MAG TPA: hypothetical protein VGI50_03810 [Solirubrobacteraceae bacterium]
MTTARMTEKTADEEARKHDRRHPDRHRHQDSHAVASWMEQAAERPDQQAEHDQVDDMKNHDERLPAREVKNPRSRLHGDGRRRGRRAAGHDACTRPRTRGSLNLDPRQGRSPS